MKPSDVVRTTTVGGERIVQVMLHGRWVTVANYAKKSAQILYAEALRQLLGEYEDGLRVEWEKELRARVTTHYLSTAENSGTLASILPSDLVGVMFDDGMAQNGSINRARSPVANYCRPPDQQAFEALADIAGDRGIPITVEAEGTLRYAYDLWLSNETECRAVMQDVATGLGYMKARRPAVPLWIEHQGQLAQSTSIPRPAYDAFMTHEASLMSSLIAGCTIMGYFTSLDFAAWDADVDFYRATMATYYPGKRIKIFASSYLYSGPQTEYVGDAAMDHLVEYALAHDCDIEWWQASSTAPMHAEAYAYLRTLLLGVGVTPPGTFRRTHRGRFAYFPITKLLPPETRQRGNRGL